MPEALTIPELYPHQKAAIAAVQLAIAARQAAGMIVLPTGCGKSATGLSLSRFLGVRTLVTVHRDELIRQWIDGARTWYPQAVAGVIQADRDEWDQLDLYAHRIPDLIVASVPSLHAKRLARIPRDHFGLVIADEAHHAPSPSWARILDHFTPGFTLGVTATPQRADGKPLTRFGREPLYSYSLAQAVRDGRLVEPKPARVRLQFDLGQVDADMGMAELARAVNTPKGNAQVVDAFLAEASIRRAVAFCVDVQHARDLAAAFENSLVHAAIVTGESSPESLRQRRAALADFRAGRIQVVCNCEVLTEGFDDPGIDCVIVTRPTESKSLFIQMVGRGLRLFAGKTDCLILDATDNSQRHKLVTLDSLLGRAPRPAAGPAQAPAPARPGTPEAPPAVVAWRLETVCPWPALPSLDGYVPTAGWMDDPASDGQVKFLRSLGLDPQEELTKGQASYLIDRAAEFEAANPTPASPKQRGLLKREGLWLEGMGRRQAQRLITQLKQRQRNQQWA
jgi:superfamily II DNA or RNA helicase